jgi:hypothetical protein
MPPDTCGGAGVPNQCGCAPQGCPAGYECGEVPNGCGGTTVCGTCAPGAVCDVHQCVPESGSSNASSSSSTSGPSSSSAGTGGSANGAGGGAGGEWIPIWGRAGCAVEPGRRSEKDARLLAFAAIALIGLVRRRRPVT